MNSRYKILSFVILAMTLSIFMRLFSLQVVKGENYKQQSEKRLMRSVPVKAPRGEILDRYGRPLVSNRMGFSVVFQNEYIKKENLDNLILNTINVFNENGQSYFDTLPITTTYPFEFNFLDATPEQLNDKINSFKASKKIDLSLDGNNTVLALKAYYKISDGYTNDQLRSIIGVRYEMENRRFGNSVPYTFATDVKIEVVSKLREQHFDFVGTDIMVEPIRQNPNGTIGAHILGRVGIIYAEEYEKLKSQNYGMNDIIGKDGIEKILEKYLKGKDGVSSIEQNIDGKMTRILDSQEAVPGNYAMLTIDLRLQQTLEKSLESNIKRLQTLPKSKDASAGSAVVIDVNSGEILAMASYPTFDPATFNDDYKNLVKDKTKPMWNRAISGQYAPGSTFKILTAIAALEENVTTPSEAIYDEGVYKFYEKSGYAPVCWIWAETGHTHGNQNCSQAIENSCNYYFYEVGRRLGIDALAKYGERFGLGQYTGIELSGEAKGIFASAQYRKQLNKLWYPGDTLQASIGQSDHLFTPIQLANYVATVVNGGKRYKTHLIRDVKSYDSTESVDDFTPKVLDDTKMKPETYKAVMDGMRKVSETGTASNVFANYKVSVGGKTGTASVSSGTANGVFVAFAPFDNPQIAIAIVVEHAGSGNSIAPIARDVFDEYLTVNSVDDTIVPYNQLMR